MEYNGKLYGKIGRKYFDTGKTTVHFDKRITKVQLRNVIWETLMRFAPNTLCDEYAQFTDDQLKKHEDKF